MKKNTTILAGIVAAVVISAGVAGAAPAKRVQVDQHGDFVLIGNTLGWACQGAPPAPVTGTVGGTACSSQAANNGDSSPDVFWRADAPADGQATADQTITPATARSTAVLSVPAGATVTHAYLYWGAKTNPLVAGTSVTLDRPGVGAFTQAVNAINSYTVNVGGHLAYESVGDITAIVQANGVGAYRVSGISTENFYNLADEDAFAGWAMIVLYELASDKLRSITVFDGLDAVYAGADQNATLTGFLVPNAGFDGKLGIVAYEGDDSLGGDQFLFNGTALTDAQNPVNNFFNATRSSLGVAVSNAGDLPQLTGAARSMAGIDLDVIDITGQLTGGMTSAPIRGTSTADTYYLGAFVTSITTYKPDFTTSTKTAVDVNGAPLLAGEDVEYTITVKNTGNDTAITTVLSDPLPVGVTYKPGTITIDGVAKSDVVGDDTAEYVAGSRTVVARLGTGATAAVGGSIAVAAPDIVVTFRVTVDLGVSGDIGNQALINAAGQQGAPAASTVTDGNGVASPGAPPTPISVDECASNANCTTAPKLVCKTTVSPKICVACLADADCGSATSGKVCNASNACVDGCRGTGGNGCPASSTCTSADATIGTCVACTTDANCGSVTSGKICTANACVDGCRGTGGNGCPASSYCTSADATAGTCVACTTDANCGGVTSGKICTANACVDGCRGTGGNGCAASSYCTSADATAGTCVACTTDANCGGVTSGKICTANACVDGCRGTGGNGCAASSYCTSTTAAAGACVACTADSHCGNATSGKVCSTTNTCIDGCRGTGGNGCPTGGCSSTNATIGSCVACAKDSDCGGTTSGKICTANACVDGCRGTGGNGCATGSACTSTDATAGTCVQCTKDADCGTATSGKICNASKQCVDGCRGTGGNGCPTAKFCTSTTATAGTCEVCATDLNCGNTLSGKICDATTHTCADGCRGTTGNTCPTGSYCTSTTAAAGACVGCNVDSNCGTATSGKICSDATHTCVDGCRGTGGNGCTTEKACTSIDATPGTCVACMQDSTCGVATSGKVCDAPTHTCVDGCRGTGGNGCASGVSCTSTDATIGRCVYCTDDSACGNQTSGRVCDTTVNACADGCRGTGGNGCPLGRVCSSANAVKGVCGPPDVVAQGNGIACSASPGRAAGSGAWLIGALLAGLSVVRRRRRLPC